MKNFLWVIKLVLGIMAFPVAYYMMNTGLSWISVTFITCFGVCEIISCLIDKSINKEK